MAPTMQGYSGESFTHGIPSNGNTEVFQYYDDQGHFLAEIQGTPKDPIDETVRGLDQMFGTPKGMEYRHAIVLADRPVSISFHYRGLSFGGDFRVSINPLENPEVVGFGGRRVDFAVVLGHEFGHAVLNTKDWANVYQNENAARRALGAPDRLYYSDLLGDVVPSVPS
jgi:hypothetical protein